MTVRYSRSLGKNRVGLFLRLLLRWRGSIYRLLYKELLIYLAMYLSISLTYRFALTEGGRWILEQMAIFSRYYTKVAPLTFILGFYITVLVIRWWSMFESIAWPDRVAAAASVFIDGNDQKSLFLKKTLMRYVNLAQVLLLREISVPVAKRYPTMQSLVTDGYMTEKELFIYNSISVKYSKFWVPWQWAYTLVKQCRQERRIKSDVRMTQVLVELMNFRDSFHRLMGYDWLCIPLAYTQVVTIAVYMYFFSCLFSQQYLDPNKQYSGYEADLFVPFYTIVEFVFYMGWLKLGESIINPLGNNDDHFEIEYIVDRNLKVSYLMVEENVEVVPVMQTFRPVTFVSKDAEAPGIRERGGFDDNFEEDSEDSEIKFVSSQCSSV